MVCVLLRKSFDETNIVYTKSIDQSFATNITVNFPLSPTLILANHGCRCTVNRSTFSTNSNNKVGRKYYYNRKPKLWNSIRVVKSSAISFAINWYGWFARK